MRSLGLSELNTLRTYAQNVFKKPGWRALAGSSWFEFAPWYLSTLGTHLAHRLVRIPSQWGRLVPMVMKDWLAVFWGRTPEVFFPSSVAELKGFVFSWAPGVLNKEILSSVKDRYLGAFSERDMQGLGRFLFCLNPPSPEFLQQISRPGEHLGFIWAGPRRWRVGAALRVMLSKWHAAGWSLRALPCIVNRDLVDGALLAQKFTAWLERFSTSKTPFLLFAYEQQPWQCSVIQHCGEQFPQIKIYGYIHSTLNNFPSQFIYRSGVPDHLFVHGEAVRRVLTQHLGWPKKAVHLIAAKRYEKPMSLAMSTMFLPYSFASTSAIVKAVKCLVDGPMQDCNLPIDVRIHPVFAQDPAHQELMRKISAVLATSQVSENKNAEKCVVVVGVSSTVFEAIEAGYRCFMISEDLVMDGYSPEIWQEILITQHGPGVFELRLKDGAQGAFFQYPTPPPQDWTEIIQAVE